MDPIELTKPERADAIASIKRYAEQNLSEEMGDLKAGALLNYILEEIGPSIYNRAVHDAQQRLQQRVMDLDGELYAEPFGHWLRQQRSADRAARKTAEK
jgi:uncharacterized protein (DUF2164 family)